MKLRQKGEAKRAALHELKARAPAPLGPEKQVDRRSTPSRHSTLGVPTKHGTLGVYLQRDDRGRDGAGASRAIVGKATAACCVWEARGQDAWSRSGWCLENDH